MAPMLIVYIVKISTHRWVFALVVSVALHGVGEETVIYGALVHVVHVTGILGADDSDNADDKEEK
jgi:hypothetical protein